MRPHSVAAGASCFLLLVLAGCVHHGRIAPSVAVQASQDAAPPQDPNQTTPGVALPAGDRLRVYLDLLGAGYQDYAQAPLGHESQGRIGWAIIGLSGKLNDRASVLIEVNPANDSATPKPACGEKGYFYPNTPEPNGPPVSCVPGGRDRVDLYRFIGLDPLSQQAGIRRAVLDLHRADGSFGIYLGRFLVPIGFSWLEAGSWTNEDATLIQRLNADANFGGGVYGVVRRQGRLLARVEGAFFRGDAKRHLEYAYQGFADPSVDTNSDGTMAGRAAVLPISGLEVRVSGRFGFNGSKVDNYRTFQLSKRKDHAVITSAQYRVHPSLRVFGEHAVYWSGLPTSSAEHLGFKPANVMKPGYYIGAEATLALPRRSRAGVVVTHEDLSRNDSLVWYLAEQGLYRAHLGARVRSTAIRAYLRPMGNVQVGLYWNDFENPFPWLSGIIPVEGPDAFGRHPNGHQKWGVVFRVQIP